ncbi:MAG: HAD-IIIC family phosphatase [Clostridium sp.]|nr:HAD-IIIC family phosphatase [Clostridium sp.]
MKNKKIKCLVWDLDNTLWDGVLLEDKNIKIKENITNIIKSLDERGILQSIASKNEYNAAIEKLKELNLDKYFLYPQINWSSKSTSIKTIAKKINIGIDTLAFIDDQQFELDEVKVECPEVLIINALDVDKILDMDELTPEFITEDSKNRRLMYISDMQRNNAEEEYSGPKEEFLRTLDMEFQISKVKNEAELRRVEELVVRTHQLNTTGYTYSYDELNEFSKSDKHKLYITGLKDKYGDYGKIGIALVECTEKIWTLKLLLMSCRVMSRGVGSILLIYIMKKAKEAGVKLRAEFLPTDRNRMMYITYKFSGFNEVEKRGNLVIFEHDLNSIQPFPNYVKMMIDES